MKAINNKNMDGTSPTKETIILQSWGSILKRIETDGRIELFDNGI